MNNSNTISFFPSFVGSKKYWINILQQYKGREFVELFCGSAVLSANLASKAILNDIDFYVYNILKNFDKQIVPITFTKDDYFKYRKQKDWWKYVFCLQKMSFSGVFRYSKNGYNVPIKKDKNKIEIQQDYNIALQRWKELEPIVLNSNYINISSNNLKGKVVVSDPPYYGSQACYNTNKFDYNEYWKYIDTIKDYVDTLIIFDRKENLEKQDIPVLNTRKMRVNGKHRGNIEGLAIYENKSWRNNMNEKVYGFQKQFDIGKKGEKLVAKLLPKLVERGDLDGTKGDLQCKKSGRVIEVKTDMYTTKNFFMERISNIQYSSPGGVWQAEEHGCYYYLYFFPRLRKIYIFKVDELKKKLIELIKKYKFSLISVRNPNHITKGYKIPRVLFKDILVKKYKFSQHKFDKICVKLLGKIIK